MKKEDKNKKNYIMLLKNLEINEDFVDKIFSESSYLNSFLYKKSKRVTSGLFLVTNNISSNEKIKEDLRGKGILFMNKVTRAVLNNEEIQKIKEIEATLLEIIALLEVAFFSGILSTMNFNIIKKVYEDLGYLIKTRKEELGSSVVVNKKFFDIFEKKENLKDISKGQKDTLKDKMSFRKNLKDTKGHIKDTKNNTSNMALNKEKKKEKAPKRKVFSERRALILDFIRKNGPVTINDISSIISDYGTKTIQRETSSMVQEGILKKEGEKRWSVYTINQ